MLSPADRHLIYSNAVTKTPPRPRTLVMSVGAGALVVLILLRPWFLSMSIAEISAWATLAAVSSLVGVGVTARNHLWSAGFLYLTALVLFHLGLPLLSTAGLEFDERYRQYFKLWYRADSFAEEAIYLSMLAVVSFAVGHVLVNRPRDDERPPHATKPIPPYFGAVGAGILAIGAAMFIGYIAVAAPQLLTGGSYGEFDRTVSGTAPIAFGMMIVAFGAAICAAAPVSRARKIGLIGLAAFTLIVLSFGARTAAMYAVVAAIVAAARVHPMPRPRVALATVMVGVLAIGIVQQVRDDGVSLESLSQVSLNPSEAISETGMSLRPVVETLRWRRVWNEPAYNGTTYFTGAVRFGESMLGIESPERDERFAGTLVAERVDHYNIGYSAVAEAFLNFGTPGVVLFFLLAGFALGRLDGGPKGDHLAAARLGVLMYALTYQVRQASNIVLTILILGLLAVEVARFVSQLKVGRRVQKHRPFANAGR